MRIHAIETESGEKVSSGGSSGILLLPGSYRLTVERDLAGGGLSRRILESLPGGADRGDSQSIRVALEPDWSYRVFYDWKLGAYAVLREPAALRPKQYRGIDAPAAAARCLPEGEPAEIWCRFPEAQGERCYRAVVDARFSGGYDRTEYRVRGRDAATAARAAYRAGQARLAQRRPELAGSAELEVLELAALAAGEPCD